MMARDSGISSFFFTIVAVADLAQVLLQGPMHLLSGLLAQVSETVTCVIMATGKMYYSLYTSIVKSLMYRQKKLPIART